MSRILNKKELKKLVKLGIFKLSTTYCYVHCFKGPPYINPDMVGQEITEKFKDEWFVYKWMIKKNWKKTGIFK